VVSPVSALLIVSCYHVFSGCVTIDGVWIGELDLLTTCVHHSEVHFTDHWHTHTHRLVSSVYQSPLAVSWQRLLPKEILHPPALRSSCQSRPRRTPVNWQLNQLGLRLAAISHQPPSLLLTRWLPTDNWTFSLTNQLLHVTSLNGTTDNSSWQPTRCFKLSCL
jgi:hypothetical protein